MNKLFTIFIFLLFNILIFSTDLSEDQTKNILQNINKEDTNKKVSLDIESAVSKALINNLTLKNNKIDYNNNVLSLATIWNQFLPGTSLSASLGQTKDYKENDTITTNVLNTGIKTSLTVNGRLILNVYQSVLDFQTGKISYDQAKSKLIYDVKKAYYNLVLTKEKIDLIQKQIDNSKATYEITIKKLEKGMIAEIDKLKSEYNYKSLILEYDSQYSDYIISILDFKKITGILDDIELTTPIPEINKIDYEKISKLSLNNNLDIKAFVQTLKNNENSRNYNIAELFPSFNLSYSLSSQFNKDITKDNWFSDLNNDWNKSSNLSFSVSIPVDTFFPLSSTQTNIIKNQNNVEKSKNVLLTGLKQVQINLITDLLKLKQIEDSFNSIKINFDIANQSYQLALRSYQAGVKNYIDLQDAQNTLFDAQIKLLNAKYQFSTYYLDLKYILNSNDI